MPLPVTFHAFSALPAEIRLQIWGDAIPGPRIIEVHLTSYKHALWSGPTDYIIPGAWSITIPKHTAPNYRVPALLHTCQDSRAVALQTYELCLKMDLDPNTIKIRKESCDWSCPGTISRLAKRLTSRPATVFGKVCTHKFHPDATAFNNPGFYFQPQIDTLYFTYISKYCTFNVPLPMAALDFSNVRSIAVDEDLYHRTYDPWCPFSTNAENITGSPLRVDRVEEFLVVWQDGYDMLHPRRSAYHTIVREDLGVNYEGIRFTIKCLSKNKLTRWKPFM